MKRTRIFLTALLIGGLMLLNPSPVFAEQVIADVTCGKDDGTEQTFGIGWDNANQFFSGKGDIARLYCEGGFSNGYPIYVRDNLPVNSPLRWFNGVVPVLEPSPEPVPSIEPSLNPEPTPIPEPTQSSSPTPEPELTPEPTPEAPQEPEPIPMPESVVEPTPEPILPDVEPEPITEPTPIALDLEPDLVPEPELMQEPVEVEPTVEELTQEVIDDALADGVLTDDEREIVTDALLAEFIGEAITFEALQESGLDYEDLPPETPVTLENGVVLSAEVADALEIFDSGAEVLATILENPAKALKALASVGEDMSEEEREVSQNTVVAAVVVTQLAQVRKMK